MSYTIHKQTYSDGRAYCYHISDVSGNLRYVAERTGMLIPSPTRLVEFFDPGHNLAGRLQPPDVAPWQRGTHYEVFVGQEAEEPYAVIEERWGLVDILLLRLPRYEVQLGKHYYVVRGSRYGERFYEIFRPLEEEERGDEEEVDEERAEEDEDRPKETKVGEIERPTAGPSYTVESGAAPLRQALLVLAALVILIDMELYS
jgi:hypothetical protein